MTHKPLQDSLLPLLPTSPSSGNLAPLVLLYYLRACHMWVITLPTPPIKKDLKGFTKIGQCPTTNEESSPSHSCLPAFLLLSLLQLGREELELLIVLVHGVLVVLEAFIQAVPQGLILPYRLQQEGVGLQATPSHTKMDKDP